MALQLFRGHQMLSVSQDYTYERSEQQTCRPVIPLPYYSIQEQLDQSHDSQYYRQLYETTRQHELDTSQHHVQNLRYYDYSTIFSDYESSYLADYETSLRLTRQPYYENIYPVTQVRNYHYMQNLESSTSSSMDIYQIRYSDYATAYRESQSSEVQHQESRSHQLSRNYDMHHVQQRQYQVNASSQSTQQHQGHGSR